MFTIANYTISTKDQARTLFLKARLEGKEWQCEQIMAVFDRLQGN